ncbi:MAG: RimK family alpha-L-glutamate ligase [Clostridia bacterium]|nr:RimK family alpha-L-glutamate ligase [Clostridia bacterium]
MQQNKGYIIINGFLREEKFFSLYSALKQSADKAGLQLELKTNIELMCDIASGKTVANETLPPFAIFWDKDVRLAKTLEAAGMKLFNSADAIELCDDKSLTHIALMNRVPQPKTVLIPLTFPRVGYTDCTFLEKIADYLGFPFVIKQCFGSFGAGVYLAGNMEEAKAALMKTAGGAAIAQQYIASSFARDIRAYIVGDKVAAAMLRHNESGDFRANVAQGGKANAYTLSEAQAALAVKTAQLLGCTFAGVDLLFGENGEMTVCEVNSNAHFAGISAATGVNIADKIIEAVAQRI